jgi:DNA-binding transcriptional regulator YdaS (Cro superfamily)
MSEKALVVSESELVEIPHIKRGKYYATNCGDIYSATRGQTLKKLKPEIISGYERVKVGGEKIFVHRLIAYTFLGIPPTDRYVVNHKNGDKRDNKIDNLEWVTYGQNLSHAYNILRRKYPNFKVTDEAVIEIRKTAKIGGYKALMEKYGLSSSTVSEIVNGKRYKNVL